MLALALAAPARAAPAAAYVGARVGYVMGRGWTLGPEVGVGEGLFTVDPGNQNRATTLVLGLEAAGDISFGDSGRPTFRAHVGPEVAAFHECPVIVVPVVGGLSLSFESGYPVALGWHGGVAALLAPLHPVPSYSDPAPSPTFLVGPAYRAAVFPGAFAQNELDLEARLLYLPGQPTGLGYCGGD